MKLQSRSGGCGACAPSDDFAGDGQQPAEPADQAGPAPVSGSKNRFPPPGNLVKKKYFFSERTRGRCSTKIETAIVFFRSMASGKMSNRSKNGLLDASNDKFKVGRSPKNETDFLPKYDFPHKMLTKYTSKSTFFFSRMPGGAPGGNRFLDPLSCVIECAGEELCKGISGKFTY